VGQSRHAEARGRVGLDDAGAAMSSARVKQPTEADSPSTIRERGAVGAALLTVRAAAAQVVAFGGTLVLAHLLLPTAFGVVAIGATVVSIANFFADGGLGAALIRKSTDPTADELRTLLALQLMLAFVIALGVALAGSRAGTVGAVTAIMACSLPLLALRAPHAIALERALEYRPIASIEFTESLAYYAWAIATVWIGWGVWGLASAAIVRALTGSVLMAMASPLPMLMAPRLVRGTLRSMLAFGIGFQAVGVAGLARTAGVNLVVAAVGGEQVLGLWSLAQRLMQVPFWLFMALWRVSYPTMARLRAIGEDTRGTVERLARLTALASGASLAPLAASAHYLIPAMFGNRWAPAAAPLAWASAGLMVSGPISVATAGYLYSERDVRTPLRASITSGIVWLGLTAALLGPMGVAGVGVAWMLASLTEAVIFGRALRRRANVRVERFVRVPVATAFASAFLAYALPPPLSNRLADGIVTAAVALVAYLSLSLAFNRADLLATIRRLRSLR
jgi:O-antigen/teichoic acid export membrane protein